MCKPSNIGVGTAIENDEMEIIRVRPVVGQLCHWERLGFGFQWSLLTHDLLKVPYYPHTTSLT